MNTKKLFLMSILALSAATARTVVATAPAAAIVYPVDTARFWDSYLGNTIVPGALLGAFTGTSIAYLAGTLYDAAINPGIISVLTDLCGNEYKKYIPAVLLLARLGAQIGAKQYWEKPLRNKLMNWFLQDQTTVESVTGTIGGSHAITEKNLNTNPEMTKTIARVCSWLGTASQTTTSRWRYMYL